MNRDLWRDVFRWLHIGWTRGSLHYRGSKIYSMHLHLDQLPAVAPNAANRGRVRVGKPGQVETLFDVLPVSTLPNENENQACYGFLLCTTTSSTGTSGTAGAASPCSWLRWDTKRNKVSLTDQFAAQCEVKLLNVVCGPSRPFEIQTRLDKMQVRMGMAQLDEEDLELLLDDPQSFQDTSEISFTSVSKGKASTLSFLFLF